MENVCIKATWKKTIIVQQTFTGRGEALANYPPLNIYVVA